VGDLSAGTGTSVQETEPVLNEKIPTPFTDVEAPIIDRARPAGEHALLVGGRIRSGVPLGQPAEGADCLDAGSELAAVPARTDPDSPVIRPLHPRRSQFLNHGTSVAQPLRQPLQHLGSASVSRSAWCCCCSPLVSLPCCCGDGPTGARETDNRTARCRRASPASGHANRQKYTCNTRRVRSHLGSCEVGGLGIKPKIEALAGIESRIRLTRGKLMQVPTADDNSFLRHREARITANCRRDVAPSSSWLSFPRCNPRARLSHIPQ
jgi:hypothetical protein